MDDLVEKIKKAEKVVEALTRLTLSIGTLLAIIKMVVESLKKKKKGKEFPPIPSRFYHIFIINTMMLKEIFKLIVAIVLFICTITGMLLLFFN